MNKIRLTKSYLNKFIKWSTSRYNICKKIDVINEILEGSKQGYLLQLMWKPEIIDFEYKEVEPLDNKERIYRVIRKKIYSSGSYCPCSSMTGYGDYLIDFDHKYIIKGIIDDYGKIIKEVERINYV